MDESSNVDGSEIEGQTPYIPAQNTNTVQSSQKANLTSPPLSQQNGELYKVCEAEKEVPLEDDSSIGPEVSEQMALMIKNFLGRNRKATKIDDLLTEFMQNQEKFKYKNRGRKDSRPYYRNYQQNQGNQQTTAYNGNYHQFPNTQYVQPNVQQYQNQLLLCQPKISPKIDKMWGFNKANSGETRPLSNKGTTLTIKKRRTKRKVGASKEI